VLVADLGLAKAIAHASGFTVVAGTSGYMSPEQSVPGGGIDVRSDVYGVGALTYHMLTGQVPNGLRASKLRPGVPDAVDAVVLRAIHRDPRRRWPSADALAAALEAVVEATRPHVAGWIRRVVAVAAVLGVVLATTAAAHAAAADRVRVHDSSGALSISVPVGWAGQLRNSGWNPSAIRLPAGHAPGLLVAPDVGRWSDPASRTPGVFVGLSRSVTGAALAPVPALPAHDGCVRQPDRTLSVAGLTGTVLRWTDCGGAPISFTEAVLVRTAPGSGVYVQIRQVGGADRTDEILRSLRVGDPGPLTAAGAYS
jgi:hypothetical protein